MKHGVDGWVAGDSDFVTGILGIEGHDEVEDDRFAVGGGSLGAVVDAAGAAAGDLEELGLEVARSQDGIASFVDWTKGPGEAVGDEGEGFDEADVPYFAGAEEFTEFLGREAAADFFLKGKAAEGGIDDAVDFDAFNVAADAGEGDGEEIHHVAGVDAGADEPGAGGLGEGVELAGEDGFAELGEKEFLT